MAMHWDSKMSDGEALMWRLEDQTFSSTFGTVMLLDKVPDIGKLRDRMEWAALKIPRLRQKVQANSTPLAHPIWVNDTHFDINYHVRHVRLPRPGATEQLDELACLFVNDPLDRGRPLWQFLVVEGLRGGKAALVQKVHHTLSDGERGVELALHYMDGERDAATPVLDPDAPDEPTATDDRADNAEPRRVGTIGTMVTDGLKMPAAIARQVGNLLARPGDIQAATAEAAETLSGLLSQVGDQSGGRSPLWTDRSQRRSYVTARVPFRPVKEAARHYGGTVNTALLTAAAAAAGDYHQRLGAEAAQLRFSMAVSTRSEGSTANEFSIVRMLLPTSTMPPGERFDAVEEIAAHSQRAAQAASLDSIGALTGVVPTPLLLRIAQMQSQTIDFATSNLKGAPFPVFIAGAKVRGVFPLGPLAGVAGNLTLISYLDNLDMGIVVDPAAVSQPELLAECVESAFADLCDI